MSNITNFSKAANNLAYNLIFSFINSAFISDNFEIVCLSSVVALAKWAIASNASTSCVLFAW